MSGTRISNFPAAISAFPTDLVPVVEIGSPNVTKKLTVTQLLASTIPIVGGVTVSGSYAFANNVGLQWYDSDGDLHLHMYVGPADNLNITCGDSTIRFIDETSTYVTAEIDNSGVLSIFGLSAGAAPVDAQSLYAISWLTTPKPIRAATGDGNIILPNSDPGGVPTNRGKIQWMNSTGIVHDHIYVGGSNNLNFVCGDSNFRWNNQGETQTVAALDNLGNMTAVSFTPTSDYRLKVIYGDVSDVGSTIDAFHIYDGAWKTSPDALHPMVLAHEVAEICPWAVNGDKDAVDELGRIVMQGVDFPGMVPMLIAEIQALRKRVAALEERQ